MRRSGANLAHLRSPELTQSVAESAGLRPFALGLLACPIPLDHADVVLDPVEFAEELLLPGRRVFVLRESSSGGVVIQEAVHLVPSLAQLRAPPSSSTAQPFAAFLRAPG